MTSIETPKDHIVLVPVDFSDLSKHALFHAAKMASLFNDRITLLHIIETGGMFSFLDKSNKALMEVGILQKFSELESDIKNQYPNIQINHLIKL